MMFGKNIRQIIAGIELELAASEKREEQALLQIKEILDTASNSGRTNLTSSEESEAERLAAIAKTQQDAQVKIKEKLANAKAVEAEELASEGRLSKLNNLTDQKERKAAMTTYDETVRIGNEPHTYSQANDPSGKGEQFLTDVINAARGVPDAQDRIARHQREMTVDNPALQKRAAGDAVVSNFPNLVVPQYLTTLYAAKPSNARPFADLCRHEDLPPEGMSLELAKGNTVSTASLHTELSPLTGTSHDDDPLELAVQTATNYQQISVEAISRGRVTENIVLNDLLDGMHTLIDSTLLTQASTGLFAAGTRLTYDSASPTITEMYPYLLKGASAISQTLKNRGAPTHVVMHPRRWFWLQSQLTSTWPWMSQPGVPSGNFGVNDASEYARGRAGRLPSGLDVIVDANVQTTCLAGAQTGGTQDTIYIVPQQECILFEPPQKEVFVRVMMGSNMAYVLLVYEFFAYTFQRYASTAFQHVDGTGTAAIAGW